jgi:hypothetical protein
MNGHENNIITAGETYYLVQTLSFIETNCQHFIHFKQTIIWVLVLYFSASKNNYSASQKILVIS